MGFVSYLTSILRGICARACRHTSISPSSPVRHAPALQSFRSRFLVSILHAATATAQGERWLSEHRARPVVMSASSLRYAPAPDQNAALRAKILALAHQHRRYGAGMIYLRLRQAGDLVNHKRVERLYAEQRLPGKRRRRKKVTVKDRQPLMRYDEVGPRSSVSK